MAATCFLTLLLIIGASGSKQPTTYDNPRIYGDCLTRTGHLSIYISPFAHELVITREFDVFRVELPKKKGYYEFQYAFMQDTAYVMRKDETIKLLPRETVLVRRGPKGFY